jgi:hypothetical protein
MGNLLQAIPQQPCHILAWFFSQSYTTNWALEFHTIYLFFGWHLWKLGWHLPIVCVQAISQELIVRGQLGKLLSGSTTITTSSNLPMTLSDPPMTLLCHLWYLQDAVMFCNHPQLHLQCLRTPAIIYDYIYDVYKHMWTPLHIITHLCTPSHIITHLHTPSHAFELLQSSLDILGTDGDLDRWKVRVTLDGGSPITCSLVTLLLH